MKGFDFNREYESETFVFFIVLEYVCHEHFTGFFWSCLMLNPLFMSVFKNVVGNWTTSFLHSP